MKKPLNRVALALWVLAVLVIVGEACSFVVLRHGVQMSEAAGDRIYLVAGATWNFVRSALMSAASLVALGTLVELLDQIRWNIRRD